MMSLHNSMHSSQMYTPGPAINFLTCFCDLPQKLHFTRSPPSPNFATSVPLVLLSAVPDAYPCDCFVDAMQPVPNPSGWSGTIRSLSGSGRPDGLDGHGVPGGDDLVDQTVGHRFLGGHDEVAVGVLRYPLHGLARVVSQHAIQEIAHAQDLLGLELDVAGLPLDPPERLVQEDPGVGQGEPLALGARPEQHRRRRGRLPEAERRE